MSFVFKELLVMGGARGRDERYLRLRLRILILSTNSNGPTDRKMNRKPFAINRKML